jgi:hypothetical protein
MPDAGQVYFLPPEAREIAKGDRPHLVMSLCPPGAETVTFAYGSTQGTDAANGAAHVLVDPFKTAFRATGLTRATYFYPSRLISYPADTPFPAPAGRIIDDLPVLRKQLKRALGFGTGVTFEADRRRSNRRGRIAEYSAEASSELDARFCIVVTEPNYSRADLQQTTIPLLDASEFEEHEGDVLMRDHGGWFRGLMGRRMDFIVAVPLIHTVYARTDLARYTGTIVDEETMRQIEAAMALHFGL